MAEVITSGKVIQKPELVLEVDDFLPPGVVGIRLKTPEEAGLMVGDGQSSEATGDVIDDGLEGESPDDGAGSGDWLYDTLPVPMDMKIISQVTRVGEDGKVLVDVIIESTDFPGITEFEARIVRDA